MVPPEATQDWSERKKESMCSSWKPRERRSLGEEGAVSRTSSDHTGVAEGPSDPQALPWAVPRLIPADQRYHPHPTSLCVLCHLFRILATVLRLVHMEDMNPGF